MPYTSLDKVKRWLRIPSEDTRFDGELSEIMDAVTRQIDLILSRFTALPIEDDEVVSALSDIEAEWCAGVFRERREPVQESPEQGRIHPYIAEAKARLLDLIRSKYLRSFETV